MNSVRLLYCHLQQGQHLPISRQLPRLATSLFLQVSRLRLCRYKARLKEERFWSVEIVTFLHPVPFSQWKALVDGLHSNLTGLALLLF